MMDFFKNSCKTIWESVLDNIVVLALAFVFSGGYLVAINKLKTFQTFIREIPTDYVLTPLVLLLIAIAVLLRINKKQKDQLSKLQQEPLKDESDARFVTHLGVWWKVYPKSEYIEDFPYCSCCEPRLKLVQIEWHPDEVYKCSKTDTEYKLYDKIPREKEDILKSLYSAYFNGFGSQFERRFNTEVARIRELNPEIDEAEWLKKAFEIGPLGLIPEKEKQEIFNKYKNPHSALNFVERHFSHYKKHFKQWKEEQKEDDP